jgi:hypothetical protein
VISSTHLGYDFYIKNRTLLCQPHSPFENEFYFETEAPIMDIYQVLNGEKLVKIQHNNHQSHKRSFQEINILFYQGGIYGSYVYLNSLNLRRYFYFCYLLS